MKFTIESHILKDAARFVARMSPSKPSQPILSGVHVHADGASGVTFTVFDYERAARTVADATVDDGGTVLVNARMLADIAGKLPSKPVTVDVSDQGVRIRSGAAKFTLPAMPVDAYPVPNFEGETVFALPAASFEDAVARVAPVASSDDVTPILGAVQVVANAGQARFMATDRYRVAEATVPATVSAETEILVPAGVAAEAAKAFTGKITVSITDRAVTISGDEGTMQSVMISGNYPPLERLMKGDPEGTSSVDAEALTDAVGRCNAVLDRGMPMRFEFGELALTLTAQSDGGATETIDCDGDEVTLSLKPQFVLDGVKACRAEAIRFEFMPGSGGKPGPVMFRGSEGFRYLLQPNLLMK